MIEIIASETARQRRQPSRPVHDHLQWRTDYLGGENRSGQVQDTPQAYIADMSGNGCIPPHFHQVDQFQVLAAGSGNLGRHAPRLIALHYVDRYTAYGPVNSGPGGLSLVTFRVRSDPGAIYLHKPGYKERLKPTEKRYLMAENIGLSTAPVLHSRSVATWESLLEENVYNDGLGAYMLRLGPHMGAAGKDAKATGGLYYLVVNGSLDFAGTGYGPWSVVYVRPTDEPLEVHAGPHGAEALILSFPATYFMTQQLAGGFMVASRSIVFTLSITLAAVCINAVQAQAYPNKPLRIVTAEPGAALDILARAVGPQLTALMGQPVIIENHPSSIFADVAAKAAPDGYTLTIGAGAIWLTQLTQKTAYDAVKDFVPITMATTFPMIVVVHPAMPVKSVQELIDLAKAKPGAINFAATASPGGASFLGGELFKSMAGINIVRVNYKGGAAAITGVIGGEVQIGIGDPSATMPHVNSGKVRGLAVTTLQPSALAPGLPTVAASGIPGYETVVIGGILAPVGTPDAIVNRLNREIVQVLNRPDIKERGMNIGVEVTTSTPAQFSAKIKSEISKWGKVLEDAGVKPEK